MVVKNHWCLMEINARRHFCRWVFISSECVWQLCCCSVCWFFFPTKYLLPSLRPTTSLFFKRGPWHSNVIRKMFQYGVGLEEVLLILKVWHMEIKSKTDSTNRGNYLKKYSEFWQKKDLLTKVSCYGVRNMRKPTQRPTWIYMKTALKNLFKNIIGIDTRNRCLQTFRKDSARR